MNTFSVRTRAVFSPDDPDAITALRLAAAGNDLDTLARMLLDKTEDEAAHAKRRYAFRMSAVHLSDITDLLNHPDFDRAVARCSRHDGFESIIDAARDLREAINQGALREVMGRARNSFAAHYDATHIAEALSQVAFWELTELRDQGSYLNVLDRLFDISFAELSHAKYQRVSIEDSIRAAMDDVLDLHALLIPVVQMLITSLYVEALGQ